jgi:hypothetical protein
MITAEAVAGKVKAGMATEPDTPLAIRAAAIPEVQLFVLVMISER